jgi:hypothetical protein
MKKKTVVPVVTKPVTPNKDSKFWIHPDDFDKIIAYAASSYNQFKAEIGGQLIVVQDDQGDFILKDPVILKQTVSIGDCTLAADALAIHYASMFGKHGKTVRHCWWHSHHTMKAYWSGTDNATILATPAKDWTISLVVNLKKEYKLRIQFFAPFLHEENVTLNMLTLLNSSDTKTDAEVKRLCEKEIPPVYTRKPINTVRVDGTTYGDYGYGSYNGYNDYDDVYATAPYDYDWKNTAARMTDVDISKITKTALQELIKSVEELTDDVWEAGEKCDLKEWNDTIKKLNTEILKYNLILPIFKTDDELESALMSFWPEDFIINKIAPNQMVLS